jgi:hypothetical protein
MNKVPADMPGSGALAHLSSRKDFLKTVKYAES